MNLKTYFDAVQSAQADVLRVANEIDAAFTLGTDEGKAQAMAQRVELDAAQAKVAEAQALYDSMKAAVATGDAAAKFVPVSEAVSRTEKKTVTRAEYEALDFQARHDFFTAGGQIVDEA